MQELEEKIKRLSKKLEEHNRSLSREMAERRSEGNEKSLERLREFAARQNKKRKGKAKRHKGGKKRKQSTPVNTSNEDEEILEGVVIEEEDASTVEQVVEAEVVEDMGLPGCTINKHVYRKEARGYDMWVEYKDGEKTWEKLYDMWADYPEEVVKYRERAKKVKKLNRMEAKAFKKPTFKEVQEIKRILGHAGNLKSRQTLLFTVLWDNGYVSNDIEFGNVVQDAPDLVKEYLDSYE
jgi:hypothetical protein